MDRIDLHTHSTVSDGTLTPSELVRHAKAMGLRALALTDHDITDGLPEARETAKEIGIELVNGVELAAWQDHTELHIVGLDIDETSPDFSAAMKKMQAIRDARNAQMIRLMQNAGMDITIEKLIETEGAGVLTRANFGSYMKKHGIVKSVSEAFDRYLGDGKPFYIPRTTVKPEEAIELILKAGGIPILAHPMLYKVGRQTLEKYVALLTECGLVGIEAYYSTNTTGDQIYTVELAKRFGLRLSGGSDFHGANKPHIEIGKGKGHLVIPYDVLEKLRQ